MITCQLSKKKTVWKGFQLSDKPILAINKKNKQAFLVNPKENIDSIFATEMVLPEEFIIQAYRISSTAPQMLQFLFSGNFNTINKNYTVFGNDVYFTKYDKASFKGLHSSSHYITFLSHESFHNIMQTNWPEVGRFDSSVLTEDDLNLMEEEYAALSKIYKALKRNVGVSQLKKLAADYTSSVNRRIEANPQYMQNELQAETCEGTATYVGMLASRAAGYDYEIMHFDASEAGHGIIEWQFDTVVPMIKEGTLTKDAIATDLVYQTGGLLCELMERLQIPNWQKRLNEQTIESPVTLYSLIAEYVQQ